MRLLGLLCTLLLQCQDGSSTIGFQKEKGDWLLFPEKVNDTTFWGKALHTLDKAIISRSPIGLALQAMDSFLNRFFNREIRTPWVKPFVNETEPEAQEKVEEAEPELEPAKLK